MRKVTFAKLHGTGNDFIVVREKTGPSRKFWTNKRTRAICDRHTGIGADGLIVLNPTPRRREYHFSIYNADGSTAVTCFNGLRCATLLMARGKEEIVFLTKAGQVGTKVIRRRGAEAEVQMDLGVPQYAAQTLPPLGRGKNKLPLTLIIAGNSHLVVWVRDFAFDWPLAAITVQQHAALPQGANVEFALVRGRKKIELRIFERGVGPTLSCGSGAVAAVLAGMREDLVDDRVRVVMPGGSLTVHYDPRVDRLFLTGPTQKVFSGQIAVN